MLYSQLKLTKYLSLSSQTIEVLSASLSYERAERSRQVKHERSLASEARAERIQKEADIARKDAEIARKNAEIARLNAKIQSLLEQRAA